MCDKSLLVSSHMRNNSKKFQKNGNESVQKYDGHKDRPKMASNMDGPVLIFVAVHLLISRVSTVAIVDI